MLCEEELSAGALLSLSAVPLDAEELAEEELLSVPEEDVAPEPSPEEPDAVLPDVLPDVDALPEPEEAEGTPLTVMLKVLLETVQSL